VAALANGVTINNGTNDIPFIALTPIPVTKENVADTVIADGFRTWDELCVGEFEQYCAEVQAGGAAEEAAMPEGPALVSADGCDYGGKIESIVAAADNEVVFNLCKPDPAFLAKMAFVVFGIQPSEWLEETGGTGELLEHPIGTGPYAVQEWIRGDQVIFNRFEDYWGDPAPAETAVLRWNQDGAARLLELQSGTADYISNIGPDDFEIVANDPNLQILQQNIPNILYFGFTNTFPPFDDVNVRQAIAMGIDRQRIVDNFFPAGSEVATHFTPCSIPNGCEGDDWWDFDPEAAKQLLADAGYPDGFETTIYYRDVSRDYLPEPNLVAVELQSQLAENLGITAEIQVMESGEFIAESQAGNLDGIHMLGWSADFPHVTNFLDYHFGQNNTQFGDSLPEVYEQLQAGSVIADLAEAAPYYAAANNAIRELVPMIPIVHSAAANAALASVEGAYNPPFGAEKFKLMNPGKDTFVEVQANEPISLYCSDESDGESLRPCTQVVETLYEYQTDSGDVSPLLATECSPSEDGLTWTCALREGVTFHDGSTFDAADVVATFTAGLDASSPLHTGNTGTFTYYDYLWDGLMNAPAE
jgi:ABC-type transport system substrate-binding protein